MSDSNAYVLKNSAIKYDQTDCDELKVQPRSRCTLPSDTETRLKATTHSEPDCPSLTSGGKTKSDKNARNANSMFPGAFPCQHPFDHGYRADPPLFPYPHDSNLGNTEFEQGTLDRIAGAEVRAHREHKRMSSSSSLLAPSFAMNPKASVFTPSQSSQWTSPVANTEGSVACYPPPLLSLSGESAATANDREIIGGSAPQMDRSGYDATSKPSDAYSSEAERAFYAEGEAELDRMMERWERDDAKYDPQSHWRNYTPRITEPKRVLPDQINLFGSLHGMTYDPNYKAYIGDGYPRTMPTRLDGSGPCTEDPLVSAQRAVSQAAIPAAGTITDILHVQTEAHVKEGMKDFGAKPNRPVMRLRLCLCDRKWYSASLMAQAEHVCVDSTTNAERQVGSRIMWNDLVRQGLVPGQPTVGQALEGVSENAAVGQGSEHWAEDVERDVNGTAVKGKDSAEGKEKGDENDLKGVIVRDFAVEAEGRPYAYDA